MPSVVESHDQIARKAYEIYRARGEKPGQDLDDWLQAEKELAKTMQQQKSPESSYQHQQPRKSRQSMRV